MIITFGKHEGKKVSELSHEYCSTLLEYKFGLSRLTPELEAAIRDRLDQIESTPAWKEYQAKIQKDIDDIILGRN